MSRLFDGGNDRLSYTAGAIVDAAPFSMAAWVKASHTTRAAEENIMRASAAASTNNVFMLGINTSNQVFGRSRTSANSDAIGDTIDDDTDWHLVVFVSASATSRFVYVDNVKSGENTTSRVPTGISAFFIGADATATPTAEFFGNIAYPAVWDIALSDSDVAALWNSGAGVNPATVQTADCVAAWLLTANENPETDSVAAFDVTTSGSAELPAFSADNPFVIGGGSTQGKRSSYFMRMMQNAGGGV